MGNKSLSTNEMADSASEFEDMYELNAPLIYRFMFWRTKDEMLAQDLTSNVFEKAWRTRKSFTGGSYKAWLFRIARTTLVDHWRKIKDIPDDGKVISEAVDDNISLDQALDKQITVSMLHKAVGKLPKDMKLVIQIRFIQGKSARETGAQLNISEANVRVIQYRALKKLRKYLR